jgi:hypothetical protein
MTKSGSYITDHYVTLPPEQIVILSNKRFFMHTALGATFELGTVANKIYRINPLTGEFTIFAMLNSYKPYDITYDLNHKIFYVLVVKQKYHGNHRRQ